jgi:(p)ppGpp synthase/HD superfamily hydrolase
MKGKKLLKDKVVKAYNFSKLAHDGQTRKFSQLPYFVHPKAVARFLEQLNCDEDLIVVALLHDTIEDCGVCYDFLVQEYGTKIATMVNALSSDKEEQTKMGKKNYLLKKMMGMTNDELTVKLADRYHNVLFLEEDCSSKEQMSFIVWYYKETRFLIDNIVEKKELTEIHKVIINKIQASLDLIRYKYSI